MAQAKTDAKKRASGNDQNEKDDVAREQSRRQSAGQSEGKRAHAQADGERTRDKPVFLPLVDIFETKDGLTIVADMPGVSQDDLEVKLDKRTLTIYGSVEEPDRGEHSVLLHEYDVGDYERYFAIGGDFNAGGIEASLAHGVLEVKIPRHPEPQARRIEVRSGGGK